MKNNFQEGDIIEFTRGNILMLVIKVFHNSYGLLVIGKETRIRLRFNDVHMECDLITDIFREI